MGAPPLTIRRATWFDVDEIVRIDLSAWEGWLELLPAGVEAPSAADMSAHARETIDSDAVEAVVAEIGPSIVGRASFGSSRDHDSGDELGGLRALFVDPGHWRQGVGRALVALAVERLRASGRREVTLWSLADSHQATAFYAAQGFVRDGQTQTREAFGHALEIRWRRGLDGGT